MKFLGREHERGAFYKKLLSRYNITLLLELICGGLKKLDDVELLGADVLALTARYTIACLAASTACLETVPPSTAVGRIAARVVDYVKYRGYRNFGRTALGAIGTAGALDDIIAFDDLDYLFDRLEFIVAKRLEIGHKRKVIVHLVDIAHTRKHHKNAFKACGVAYRKACVTATEGGK